MGVRVGIGVGGGRVAVAVGHGEGGSCDSVGTGLSDGGWKVNVGNPTAGVACVGLKTAVMVRSGVGKTIGVGAETNGKLQARAVRINIPVIKIGIRFVFFMVASSLAKSFFNIAYW